MFTLAAALVLALFTVQLAAPEAYESPTCQAGDPTCRAHDGLNSDYSLLQLKSRFQSSRKQPAGRALDGSHDINGDPCAPQYCMLYGDPHIVSFDGGHGVFTDHRTFWLVKSERIQIQGVANVGHGRISKIIAGGPFLNGKTLLVDGFGQLGVKWDGESILTNDEDQYVVPGLLNLQRLTTPLASAEHMRDLPDHEALEGAFREARGWGDGDQSAGIFNAGHLHLQLPDHVEIFVAKAFEVLIKMPRCREEMSGACENFNGDPADDHPANAEKVQDENNLFPALVEAGVAVATSGCPKDCSQHRCNAAHKTCVHLKEKSFHEACIYDVCHGEDGAEAAVAAVMEVEDARGIAEFVGHGKCQDPSGKDYTTFVDEKITDAVGCKQALVSSDPPEGAKGSGVWGAQFKRGSGCQLLVAAHHTPLHTWSKVSDGPGEGMVSSVAPAKGYICWKLL